MSRVRFPKTALFYGLDLGVLSPTLFTMLVIMAVVTTVATTPIVHALTGTSDLMSDAPTPKASKRSKLSLKLVIAYFNLASSRNS
ncbi:MAG: hypothetical protein ACRD4S_13890 [Candidatus Acidiferrales bacterium]